MANTFNVGDLEVLVVSDGTARVPGPTYFPATTNEQWQAHQRWLDHDGNVEFSFSCFVIRAGDKRVLIDTGMGSVKFGPFNGGELLPELAAAGVKPEDMDVVFMTHLHFDHCGAAALKEGEAYRPTFPNAAYRWTSAEETYWSGDTPAKDMLPESVFSRKELMGAVASRYEPVEDGGSLAPGLSVVSLPGHTPGHAGVIISSGAERAFVLGDAISCPVQLEEPEWSGLGDMDPTLARRTQEAVAREIEGSGALAAAGHFPGLTFGRVLRGEGKRYWQPL